MNISEIYISYYSRLVRFATDFVMYEEDAENIIQDLFVALWEKKETMAQVENMNAYMFRLTRNRCLDYLKHKVIQGKYVENTQSVYEQELKLKLQSLESFNIDISPEEKMEKMIANAIHSLPCRCREIFTMSRFDGLKYREISEKLDISVNTVETQMGIALKKLRSSMNIH